MNSQQLLVAGGSNALKAITAVTLAGLTSNLVLCLDAGDANSYTSGSKWLDVSGNGYDFDFTGTPTFTGSVGSLAAYWDLDGVGDLFTYDAANETWMNSIHKDSAVYTLIAFALSTAASRSLAGTSADDDMSIGFALREVTNTTPRLRILDSSGTAAFERTAASPAVGTSGAWNMWAVSVNEAGGAVSFFNANGSSDAAFDAAYTTPSASDATYTMQIGAAGNSIQPLEGRIAIFMAWSGTALTSANMATLFGLLRGRYGI